MAPPASPAAGWIQIFLNRPSRRIFAVRHAVQRDAAGEAEILRSRLRRQRSCDAQDHLLEDNLDRSGDVHVDLLEVLLGLAHGDPEETSELLVRHDQADAIVEIGHVEPEAAVRLQIDEVVQNELCEPRLPVGRETHQLVFARIDAKAGEVGEGGVEKAERMRKVQLLVKRQGACHRPSPSRWWSIRRPRPS